MKREDPILHYFKKIHDKAEKQGNANLKEIGLTLAQGHILGLLRYSEGYRASLKEVEHRMKVAQSTTAGMVARLESNGFVETLIDSEDKRIKIVVLTDKGFEATTHVRNSMDKVQNQLLQNLTIEEQKQLKDLIMKMASDELEK